MVRQIPRSLKRSPDIFRQIVAGYAFLTIRLVRIRLRVGEVRFQGLAQQGSLAQVALPGQRLNLGSQGVGNFQ
jgi:hypothetical protein